MAHRTLAQRKQRSQFVIALAIVLLVFINRKQRRHRNFLSRSSLLPNPSEGTPWQALYAANDDRAYIVTMGVGVAVFQKILQSGFADTWNSFPIPRNDTRSVVHPRLGKRSLDAAGALGLILHYLNSTMADFSLQQIFALTPAVESRYRNWGLCILQATLRCMKDAAIAWPSRNRCEKYADMIKRRHPLVTDAIGFVDGCHLPVATSSDLDIQNAFYNGWCSAHFTSNLFVFAPDGTIIHATLNAPGSWHDAVVARDLYHALLTKTENPFYVIGDTAFPTNKALEGKIRTPPKSNFNSWPNDMVQCYDMIKFFEQLVSARQAAEWGMRCLQGSFGRLRMPMPAGAGLDSVYRYRLLEVCSRLHNVRTRCEGINQIKTVYEGLWKSSGVYWDIGEMLFKDIRRNDRIRRYYNFVP